MNIKNRNKRITTRISARKSIIIGMFVLLLAVPMTSSLIFGDFPDRYRSQSWLDARFVNTEGNDAMIGNLTLGASLFMGTSEGDSYIYFYEDGSPTSEYIRWWNDGDRFHVSDFLYVTDNVQGENIYASLGIYTDGDLYTRGTGNDLWLGSFTQGSSNFQAYADGNLIMSGNATIGGNITAENVFLHAHIYTHTDVALNVTSAGEWVNITWDSHEAPIQSRITHTWNDATNDTFTIVDAGEYRTDVSLVGIDATATPDSQLEYRVTRNGIEINGSGRPIDIDRQDYDRSKDSWALYDFEAGDKINFQFTSDSTTAGIVANCLYLTYCTSAAISIERVG